jgi:hypothetical protein
VPLVAWRCRPVRIGVLGAANLPDQLLRSRRRDQVEQLLPVQQRELLDHTGNAVGEQKAGVPDPVEVAGDGAGCGSGSAAVTQ